MFKIYWRKFLSFCVFYSIIKVGRKRKLHKRTFAKGKIHNLTWNLKENRRGCVKTFLFTYLSNMREIQNSINAFHRGCYNWLEITTKKAQSIKFKETNIVGFLNYKIWRNHSSLKEETKKRHKRSNTFN